MTDSIKIDFIKEILGIEYTGHTDKENTDFIKSIITKPTNSVVKRWMFSLQ